MNSELLELILDAYFDHSLTNSETYIKRFIQLTGCSRSEVVAVLTRSPHIHKAMLERLKNRLGSDPAD